MAISFVGQASAAAASVALPTFSADDIAIVFAFRSGSTTAPSLPSGWTNDTSAGANTCSYRVGWRRLVGGDTTTGTWTNATSIEVIVLRGVDLGSPLGGKTQGSGSSAAPSWGAVTFQDLAGGSWAVLLGGHRTATDMNTVALGTTTNESPTEQSVAMHDVRGTTSWSSTSKTVNASSGWFTRALEVRAALGTIVSQVVAEAAISPTDLKARVSQVVAEAAISPTDVKARVSQVVAEVVAPRSNAAVVSQVVAEVVHTVVPANARFWASIID